MTEREKLLRVVEAFLVATAAEYKGKDAEAFKVVIESLRNRADFYREAAPIILTFPLRLR